MSLSNRVCGAILLLVMTIGYSCNTSVGNQKVVVEKMRVESYDHKVDAVLVETGVDATTSNGVNIFIVKHGKKITAEDGKYSIFNCDHNSGVGISWTANKELSIAYNRARIFNYTNFWESGDVDDFKYIVEVSLNCVSNDHHQLDESQRNR